MPCVIKLGPKCRVVGVSPEVVLAVEVIRSHAEVLGVRELWLAHGVDGRHRVGSLHYVGEALDITLIPAADDLYEMLADKSREALGQHFDLLHESRHTSNEHLHLEHQEKLGVNLA